MTQHIIGFAGRAGSGKDSAADILVTEYGFSKTGFARKVKTACQVILGLSWDQLYGTQEQKNAVDPFWGFSPRTAMQAMGDNLRDHLHPDVWVKALELELPRMPGVGVAIIDARYPNEVAMIQRLGGKIVKVERATSLTGVEAAHRSEHALDGFTDYDAVLLNTGTLDQLRLDVRKLADSWGLYPLSHEG